ncbi:SusC/RagA family TonB-linked outer membrane protein [Hymenobacter sp. DG25A]|uniref:SusC/RagA family TonB-linked outer membrane protein n=1 Tax=Hymenobacter sp. DG25A TaxID=1385663 RepID=UPI0006BDCBA0|nr:SusC/RagA family TonB-linked outer membrane protein [Hymenobacter sp. DG25A]ALD20286.1 hypothetical protein AM218_02360 [Hymenobacter sp. DG25A]
MKKILFMSILLMVGLLQQAFAQDRAISGRVTDRTSGEGLPGVTVLAKGTTAGASTNADGTYSLSVPASATVLTFSSIGYVSIERPIGSASTIDISLAPDTKQLGEVVVTALGVERSRNSLPYAATQVEGSSITQARNPNFINSLSGKVAGLSIRQGSGLGASTNVTIRGTKSIGGNNQALFVVDGVPISNANTNSGNQTTGRGGYDYGNAAADINPDDIASMSVLKGAAATALYGSRASNGVILITTKKGRKGLGVTINTGATVGKIDKSTFIKHQTQYGAGYGPYYDDPSGFFGYTDVNGDGTPDLVAPTTEDASFGARFDPSLQVYQWDSFFPGSPNFGKATPWVAGKNGADTFFQTASTLNNSISVDGGNDAGTFKLGYNRVDDRGILENSKISKNIVNFAGSLNVSPKLTTSASVNFSRVDGKGRYGTGYDSKNIMTNMRQWWQTNVDLKRQREEYFRNKTNATWNIYGPTDVSPIYWDNPYFTRYENYETDNRTRVFGNVSATYKFADWFNVLGRVTLDSYDELQEERTAVGAVDPSNYSRFNRTSREANYDLIGNFSKNFTEDFTFRGLIGANMRRERFSSISASTNGGLVVPRLYSLSNSLSPMEAPIESDQRRAVDGLFASTTFGYKELVFLDLTGRRDKSSTLPEGKNTYYYPSAATSFVFSELMKDSPWLSYGKVRLNYAEVGADAPIYSIRDAYDKPTAFGSTALFSIPVTKNNPDLKPERTKSYEAGLEMQFMQNRLGFDATVYKTNTIDQIIAISISSATGYAQRFINAGNVENKGLELSAFVTPVRNDNFNWTVNANFTKNKNTVISLTEGVDNLVIASYQGGISSNATVGRPFGTFRGTDYVYDANGNKVMAKTATNAPSPYYKRTGANAEIGNPSPDWFGGVTNTVSYKGLSLTALVDVRKGGSVFSLDRYYGLATGMTPETAGTNELGNPSRDPIVRNADGTYASTSGGIIQPGVYDEGTILNGVDVSGQPNDRRAANNAYGLYGYVRQPTAGFVYDASFVKLREVALTYSLPSALVAKVAAFKGIDLSLIGRNLWIIHKNLPDADPEESLSSGNVGQGYSSGAYPTTRSVGANIRFRF